MRLLFLIVITIAMILPLGCSSQEAAPEPLSLTAMIGRQPSAHDKIRLTARIENSGGTQYNLPNIDILPGSTFLIFMGRKDPMAEVNDYLRNHQGEMEVGFGVPDHFDSRTLARSEHFDLLYTPFQTWVSVMSNVTENELPGLWYLRLALLLRFPDNSGTEMHKWLISKPLAINFR